MAINLRRTNARAPSLRKSVMKPLTRALIFAPLVLALASCGGKRGGHPYGIPTNFSDTKPIAWRGKVPAHYPVHGVDVSRYQGQIDWPRVAASGVSFAQIKATEGGDVADPAFEANWAGAAAAGIPRGAYHFYYFCRSGAEQAQWFIQHVPPTAGALPPVLDIEWTMSRNCPVRPSPEEVRAEAASFLAIVGQHYGQQPLIYTTVDFFRQNEMWRLGAHQFWLRSVAGHPQDTFDGHHWTFWQYTGTGLVRGIDGEVDLNAFAGAPEDWAAWLAAHRR
jgi:lysozyme